MDVDFFFETPDFFQPLSLQAFNCLLASLRPQPKKKKQQASGVSLKQSVSLKGASRSACDFNSWPPVPVFGVACVEGWAPSLVLFDVSLGNIGYRVAGRARDRPKSFGFTLPNRPLVSDELLSTRRMKDVQERLRL